MMSSYEMISREEVAAAAETIRARTAYRPRVGVILGSGLNSLADEAAEADRIPYREIPGFPLPGIAGHAGQLVIGMLAGQPVALMQGRAHGYEGGSPQRITFPVRVLHALGVRTLIVTNAAGGLNPGYQAGDLMLISDHLGLAAMMGQNPLFGPNDESLGPRFVDMTKAYDPELRRLAREVAARLGLTLHQGVYVGVAGPSFETPAEIRFLRQVGGDAVGMSSVSEVIVARHMGMRVLAFSGISNLAIDDPDSEASVDHEEVLAAGRAIVPKLLALLRAILGEMSNVDGAAPAA